MHSRTRHPTYVPWGPVPMITSILNTTHMYIDHVTHTCTLNDIPKHGLFSAHLLQVMEFVFGIMQAFSDPATRKKFCMVRAEQHATNATAKHFHAGLCKADA